MLLRIITDYLRELTQRNEYALPSEIIFEIGPQHDFSEKTVNKVLITQNLTIENIIYAKKTRCNLIICRYGIIPQFLNRIDEPSQKFFLLLLQSRIMVCILPSSWDYTDDGPIDFLSSVLNLEFQDSLWDKSEFLGRMYETKPSQTFENLLARLHRNLNMDIIYAFSNLCSSISKVFFCFPDTVTLQKIICCAAHQCDCLLGTAISSTAVPILKNYNINFIEIPFSYLLEPALQKFCVKLAVEFPRIEFDFYPSKSIIQFYKRKQNH